QCSPFGRSSFVFSYTHLASSFLPHSLCQYISLAMSHLALTGHHPSSPIMTSVLVVAGASISILPRRLFTFSNTCGSFTSHISAAHSIVGLPTLFQTFPHVDTSNPCMDCSVSTFAALSRAYLASFASIAFHPLLWPKITTR